MSDALIAAGDRYKEEAVGPSVDAELSQFQVTVSPTSA